MACDCLAGVLEAMQKQFKAPPQPVLDAWVPSAVLDAAGMSDSEDLLEGRLLETPPPLSEAVCLMSTSVLLTLVINNLACSFMTTRKGTSSRCSVA